MQDTEAGDGIYIQKVDVQKTKAGKGKPNKVVTDKGRVRVSLFDCNSHVILGDSKNQHLQSSRRICLGQVVSVLCVWCVSSGKFSPLTRSKSH